MTDRKTRSQERTEALETSPTALLAQIEQLKAELAEVQAKSDEYLGALQRERAGFTNYRRRAAEEREATLGLASESLLRKVLALADDFDLAIERRPDELAGDAWVEGIVAIDRKLRGVLESEGVTAIESVGQPFDPRLHDAITSVDGTGRPEGEVVGEVRRGYRLRDRILRPALVAVAGTDGLSEAGDRAGGRADALTAGPNSADGGAEITDETSGSDGRRLN